MCHCPLSLQWDLNGNMMMMIMMCRSTPLQCPLSNPFQHNHWGPAPSVLQYSNMVHKQRNTRIGYRSAMVVVQAMRAVTAVSATALPGVLKANNTVEASVMHGAPQSGDQPSTCCMHTVCAGVSRRQQPMIKRQQPLLLGACHQFK